MIRKRLRSVTMLVCMIFVCGLLAACGADANNAPNPDQIELSEEDQQQWFASAEQFILSMNDAVATGTSVLTQDDPVYGPAFEGWEKALPEIGEVVSVEGESTEFTKNEGTIRMLVKGTSHDAEVVINLEMGTSYYELTGVTTNIIYSFKELMQQAGLNTLLGMGMTFTVLILLSIIIAIFGKVIGGAGREKPARKKKQKEAPAEEAPGRALTEGGQGAEAQTAAAGISGDPMNDPVLTAVIAAAVAAYESDDLSPETVAVIAAAVAAYEGAGKGYVVRKIRKSRRHIS